MGAMMYGSTFPYVYPQKRRCGGLFLFLWFQRA